MTTVADPKPTFDLNMHTHRLLSDEPFFAALSRRIDKRATTSIPTAGVIVSEEGRFEMLYNPVFMQRMVDECRETKGNADNPYRWIRGILMHEFYHLILGHCTTRKPEGGLTKTWNVAMDLAINSHIPDELPPSGCIPGRGPFDKFPTGLSADAYYKLLQDDQQASQDDSDGSKDSSGDGDGDGQGGGGQSGDDGDEGGSSGSSVNMDDVDTLDSHEGWGEAESGEEGTNQQIAEERLKDMVQKAAEEAGNRGWGSVSSSMRKTIIDAITTKVDWRKVLRSFVKASQKSSRRSTVKRINRRFPYIHAGKRSERVARVAISIDQSGSVSDSMLAAFFSELDQLAKYAEFVVVPFDTTVDENLVYTWKKGEKKQWERVMCGGTDFDAPTRYVNENGFDGHIILTDMGAPKPIPSKCQRMWMTDSYGATQPYFKTTEKVLEIVQ
jgi:predicted metal-dependent peptidase